MSEEKKKTDGVRARTRAKREVPKSANVNPSRSGWIAILVVLAMFLAMRYFSRSNGDKVDELSATGFRRAVVENRIASVERVRDMDSSSTYLRGKYILGGGTNPSFHVRLVPGENEELMNWLVERGVECPVREHAPLIGPLMQQLLFFLLLIGFF